VFQQQSTAVASHVSVLAAKIESRSDAYLAVGSVAACILLAFLYNWQTTRNSKGGYQRFINWTSAQRAEARQHQAERRRRPSPVAVETKRQAETWWKTGWVVGLVSFGFGIWAAETSTPAIKWTAIAIFGVGTIASLTLSFIGVYLEFRALKQQREYDELQST
jgi:hypothetical protein